jgi:vacuolar-type H+-ATPase subunit F/Vma7
LKEDGRDSEIVYNFKLVGLVNIYEEKVMQTSKQSQANQVIQEDQMWKYDH